MNTLSTVIKDQIRSLYYYYYHYKIRIKYFFRRKKINESREIPIIINSFNRFSFLKRLIVSLEIRGLTNIYIIDNDSTYPPLLEYYKSIPYEVIFLKQNIGFRALWKSNLYKRFCYDYYIYTDPDVELIEECPNNFLDILFAKMKSDNKIDKIGLSLKIDDLPDHFANKNKVIEWEQQYYEHKVGDCYFKANVDTTFALYRPGLMKSGNLFLNMLRSDYPYQLRHLPWYLDNNTLDEEELYYFKHSIQSTHWTRQLIDGDESTDKIDE